MASYPQPLRMTVDEYLAFEEAATEKHEFFHGEVYAMAGGSLNHGILIVSTVLALGNRLIPKGCIVTTSDVRVRNASNTLYTYPDVTVTCAKPEILEQRGQTLSNPCLVVEVLSPSTRNHDLNRKASEYKRNPSLQYLLFLDSVCVSVQVHSRLSPDAWRIDSYLDGNDEIELASLGVAIPVRELYQGVSLPPG